MINTRWKLLVLVLSCVVLSGVLAFLAKENTVRSAVFLAAGILAGLGIQSFYFNNRSLEEREALRFFFGRGYTAYKIVIPSDEKLQTPEDKDKGRTAPFLPLQDALAAFRVVSFIQTHLGGSVEIISARQASSISDFSGSTVVLVGGPYFNPLAEEFCRALLDRYECEFYHWAYILERSSRHNLALPEPTTLLKLFDHQNISQQIKDVYGARSNFPVLAHGMYVHTSGLFGDNRVAMLAGVSSAFGTLAAAEYLCDLQNLGRLTTRDLQVIVSSERYGNSVKSVAEKVVLYA